MPARFNTMAPNAGTLTVTGVIFNFDETLINLTEAKERTLLTIATWLSSCPELALQYAAGKGIRQGLKDMYEATQGVSLASVQEVDQLVKEFELCMLSFPDEKKKALEPFMEEAPAQAQGITGPFLIEPPRPGRPQILPSRKSSSSSIASSKSSSGSSTPCQWTENGWAFVPRAEVLSKKLREMKLKKDLLTYVNQRGDEQEYLFLDKEDVAISPPDISPSLLERPACVPVLRTGDEAPRNDIQYERVEDAVGSLQQAPSVIENDLVRFRGKNNTDEETIIDDLSDMICPREGVERILKVVGAGAWGYTSRHSVGFTSTIRDELNLPVPEAIVTSEDIKVVKQLISRYRLGVVRLGSNPAETLFLESTLDGVYAAYQIGAMAIGVCSKEDEDTRRMMTVAGAKFVVESLEEVTAVEVSKGKFEFSVNPSK